MPLSFTPLCTPQEFTLVSDDLLRSSAMRTYILEVITIPPPPLFKQKSWSPDSFRDEAWLRRQDLHRHGRRSRSVTEEDLDELKGCIELGFGFDSPELDRKLSDTFPALGLFYSVNKNCSADSFAKSPPPTLFSSSFSSSSSCCSLSCDGSSSSPIGSPRRIVTLGDDPQVVKARLRQWAQVVACSVRQSTDFRTT
ncbi:hypothetical protein Sjap_017260 [Stephania japonica]|uniref:Uncharacterized protein n=1 Tax=Stephania japonica TaxID=461633 RepID=A0AAP0I5X7_9MAGN